MKRKHIPLKEKLAAALYEVEILRAHLKWYHEKFGKHVPPIEVLPNWRIMKLSADEVISKWDLDHVIYHAHDGRNIWSNLTPTLREEHREKTKRDLGIIAKGKRIQKKRAAHISVMTSKAGLAIDSDREWKATMYGAAGGGGSGKQERIQRKQAEHQARMEAKHAGTENGGSDGAGNAKAKRSRAQFGRRLSRSRKPISRIGRHARQGG